MLDMASIPVAKGDICADEEDLENTIKKIGYPIVVKPLDGNHGRGVSLELRTQAEVEAAYCFSSRRLRLTKINHHRRIK